MVTDDQVAQPVEAEVEDNKSQAVDVERIARACHNANRAICIAAGDDSQAMWEEAEEWQKASARRGVEFRLKHPEATAEEQHNAWMKDKLDTGWVWGYVKNPEAKIHPALVPYDKLPFEQRVKDHVFSSIVDSLK